MVLLILKWISWNEFCLSSLLSKNRLEQPCKPQLIYEEMKTELEEKQNMSLQNQA